MIFHSALSKCSNCIFVCVMLPKGWTSRYNSRYRSRNPSHWTAAKPIRRGHDLQRRKCEGDFNLLLEPPAHLQGQTHHWTAWGRCLRQQIWGVTSEMQMVSYLICYNCIFTARRSVCGIFFFPLTYRNNFARGYATWRCGRAGSHFWLPLRQQNVLSLTQFYLIFPSGSISHTAG